MPRGNVIPKRYQLNADVSAANSGTPAHEKSVARVFWARGDALRQHVRGVVFAGFDNQREDCLN
jgi:hypothetical protein